MENNLSSFTGTGKRILQPNRAYQVCDGDVVSVCGRLLEYENRLFYEVIEQGDRLVLVWEFGAKFNPNYKRTGKVYTIEEANEWFKNQ